MRVYHDFFCYPDQRFLKWIRIRPNDTDPTGSGSETLPQTMGEQSLANSCNFLSFFFFVHSRQTNRLHANTNQKLLVERLRPNMILAIANATSLFYTNC